MAIKTGARVKLRSRNGNDFNGRYSAIANALSSNNHTLISFTYS